MNRDLWFRILQVAVVAPYAYSISEKQENPYFKLGLKLVAAAVLIRNAEPLIREIQPIIQAAIKLQAEQNLAADRAKQNAIEGEFTDTTEQI